MFNIFSNKVYKVDKNGKRKRILGFIWGLRIKFSGKNSEVILHEPLPKFSRCKVYLGNNCKFEINSSKFTIKKLRIAMQGYNTQCYIGQNFSSTSAVSIHVSPGDNLSVRIGDNCMFAKQIIIRANDGHTIIDKDTKQILNYGKDIVIGNNVWVADNSTILKGVKIGDGSVIGCGSIVTKDCDKNSIYAGVPAKKVKSNICWDRESLDSKN